MDKSIIIAGIFTIIGAIIGATCAYLGAIRLFKKQTFSRVCEDFIGSFTKAISELQEINSNTQRDTTYNLLRDHSEAHRRAMNNFRHFLADKKRLSFDYTWIAFSGEDYEKQGIPKRYYPYNIERFNPEKTELEMRNLALRNLEKLLEFANYHK